MPYGTPGMRSVLYLERSKTSSLEERIEMRNNLGNWKIPLGTTALAAGLTLFLGAPGAKANDECQERIVKADHRLHEAIRHHGYESKQAERGREELQEARHYCWEHSHKW